MNKIKLFKKDTMDNGTVRLQSQLSFYFDKDSVDFILEDGILKCWGNGNNGFNFYKTDLPYEIVENKSDMVTQCL